MIYIELDEFTFYDKMKEHGSILSLEACKEIINDSIELGCDMSFDPVALDMQYRESAPDEIREDYRNHVDIAMSESTEELVSVLNDYTTARMLSNGNILYTPF